MTAPFAQMMEVGVDYKVELAVLANWSGQTMHMTWISGIIDIANNYY